MTTTTGGVPPQGDFPREGGRATRWLSRGFEELIFEHAAKPECNEFTADFDVVIVGSGYGGAVAAAELSSLRGSDKTVCVLERGREYLQGSFPTRMADLASHVRFAGGDAAMPRGYREGLFDVRVGKDVSAVLANGVGGGSLINAGVMLMPSREVFDDTAWPKALRGDAAFDEITRRSAVLKARLGATHTVKSDGVRGPEPHKYTVLGQLSPSHFDAVPITVALADGTRTSAGVSMDTCVRCGDCATGCNHNAKLSLDVTLLAEAVQNGAQVFAGATLLRIEKQQRAGLPPLWKLHLVHTEENLRRRQGTPFVLRAEHVVLAAGTLGSTEILMRSQTKDLRFSPRLGHRFSANGDMIAAVHDTQVGPVDCVGDETLTPESVPSADRIGPTITGMVDLRAGASRMAIQDLGVPGALRRLFEEVVTTSASLHLLGEGDDRPHYPEEPVSLDPCAIDAERMRKSLLVVMMSRDPAEGRLEMSREGALPDAGDGALSIHWPELRDHPPFSKQHDDLQQMLSGSPIKGQVLANPVWRPLPVKLDYLLEGARGPLLTVHPLGGCPMGDSVFSGVVDDRCRVFDAAGSAFHEGLAVLDGSVIPASLGINPALTIASVAQRAVQQLCEEWGFTEPCEKKVLPPRPWFRLPAAREKPRPTVVEVLERLSGPLKLEGFDKEVHAELTMRFDPIELRRLMVPGARLALAPARGKLRIFKAAPPGEEERKDDDGAVLLVAEISGSLRVFHHEASTPLARRWRGLRAWIPNRGLRDIVLWALDWKSGDAPSASGESPRSIWKQAWDRVCSAWQLSSRAGAVRLMSYDLRIDNILRARSEDGMPQTTHPFLQQTIRGTKRLTYSRRGNPWRQLMEVKLDTFPGLAPDAANSMLRLDPGYLAWQGMPLLRIVGQQDQPSALVDVASLGLYMLRILLHVHVWSFRAPDKPRPRRIDRFAGKVEGLPLPEVFELRSGTMPDGSPIFVRLTRYRFDETRRAQLLREKGSLEVAVETPVLLIHGYSASGTTFAHHAVRPNLASALWDAERDVWIVDMRTSAAMPHARHPWSFEEVARADIPVAIHHVLSITGKMQVDVFAHCMGSAMLGMALLGPKVEDESFWPLRDGLHSKIRSLVISQVAPAMIFTPANVFRAYAMRYLNHYLPLDNYQFRVSDTPGLAEQLTDRLLATLPYPESEFDRENPLWTPWRRTPWVATRHRMDALYGRDFSLNNVSDEMLDHIDDHFGPLSLQTVSQVIHFARFRSIANRQGFNEFLDPEKLRKNYDFPVMCVHGEDNGLVSVQTLDHFMQVMKDATTIPVQPARFKGFGHQDCLIGTGAVQVFEKVIGFFDGVKGVKKPPASAAAKVGEGTPAATDAPQDASKNVPEVYASQVPAFGLRLDIEAPLNKIVFSTGDHGGRGYPLLGVFAPVIWKDERLMLASREGDLEPSEASLPEQVFGIEPAVSGAQGIGVDKRLTFSFLRPSLPEGADGWLVMLMYCQSEEVGQIPQWRDKLLGHREIANKILRETEPLLESEAIDPQIIEGENLSPAMIESLLHVFEKSSNAILELGILRPPLRSQGGTSATDVSRPGPTTVQAPTPASAPVPVRSFVLASCQYPGGMLDRTPPGTPEEALPGPSDASYLRMRDRLRAPGSEPAPSFLILAGDQVYVDATAGLFDPRGLDDQFRLPYESFLGSRGARSVLGRLPAYMVLDDHEIIDNWEEDSPGATPRQPVCNRKLLQCGVAAFFHYQRNQDIVPDPYTASMPTVWPDAANPLFKATVIDGLSFFLADSRTERIARLAADGPQADLMHARQVEAIDAWFRDRSGSGPRFFVSSAMVLPRQLGSRGEGHAVNLRSDAWDGYPVALHRLLAGVFERGTDDVVFLSGDAHLGNFTRIELTCSESDGRTVVAHSVHCPALYAPYPFANAVAEDFARIETFEFDVPDSRGVNRRYQCAVQSWFPEPGDGFAVLRVERESRGWRVDVEFDRAGLTGGLNSTKSFVVRAATERPRELSTFV
ncbi:choline dehydrogenase-like flavoprotein [Variovorax boronicumulans]|uniref:alpha/beta fold hydrolase n=1 Tax=Variovorax boronicumulans TaxID=436515 RepID=UPI0027876AA4|nr:alpha/beta fold hydrolase [Variovorax boronicumulans]MDQ0036692.1 choline dehydrogenase-like flavoprotein [Variovorax boronicumulans]